MCIYLYTHSLLLSSIPLGEGEAGEEASRGMCHNVVFTVIDVHVIYNSGYTCIM